MKKPIKLHTVAICAFAISGVFAVACGGDDDDSGNTGGTAGHAGSKSTGGKSSTGGTTAEGGTGNATGGTSTTGGTSANGGSATGGASTGGASETGGTETGGTETGGTETGGVGGETAGEGGGGAGGLAGGGAGGEGGSPIPTGGTSSTGGAATGGSHTGGTTSTGGTAGTSSGGTAGASSGGTAGANNGGTAGAAGNAGTAGAAGNAGAGGAACGGCAVLSTPLTEADKSSSWQIWFNTPIDVTGGTLTVRVRLVAGTTGGFQYFGQDTSFKAPSFPWVNLSSLADGAWHEYSQVLSGGDFDPTQFRKVGLQIAAGSGTSWTSPSVVEIDSVTITGSATTVAPYTFETSYSPVSGSELLTGATVTWRP